MKKIGLVLVALGLFFAASVWAGGGGESAAEKPAGKILIWHAMGGTEAEVFDEVMANFALAHPDIEVELLVVAFDEMRNKFETAAASGSGPDIMIGPNDWIGFLADAGLIKPIDDLGFAEKDYVASAVNALRFEGHLYGVPLSFKPVAMYYNKTMVSSPAKTLDELVAQAADGKVIALNTGFYHAFWGIQDFGGKLFDENGKCILDQGGFADWLDWLASVNGKPGMVLDRDYNKLNAMFKEGQAAYYPDGPWALGDLQKALGVDQVGVAPLPAGPKGPSGPFLGVDNVMFNAVATDANTRLAFVFAQFLANKENQTLFMNKVGQISANLQVDVSSNPALKGFVQQSKTAVPFPNIPEMGAVWSPGDAAYTKVMEGLMNGEQAAKETADLINEANKK